MSHFLSMIYRCCCELYRDYVLERSSNTVCLQCVMWIFQGNKNRISGENLLPSHLLSLLRHFGGGKMLMTLILCILIPGLTLNGR